MINVVWSLWCYKIYKACLALPKIKKHRFSVPPPLPKSWEIMNLAPPLNSGYGVPHQLIYVFILWSYINLYIINKPLWRLSGAVNTSPLWKRMSTINQQDWTASCNLEGMRLSVNDAGAKRVSLMRWKPLGKSDEETRAWMLGSGWASSAC